ncbi:MAG: SGNH/GDSL hydrolase family protein [Bacteroidaceae bacterium]|nr:SGNH/GDSL hydrolase family protein [Bacteroidaceae bacterium]
MKTKMQITLAIILHINAIYTSAQDGFKWFNPQETTFQVVEGQAFPNECKGVYTRFSDERLSLLPWGVATNAISTAGLTLRFHSNASEIRINYVTTSNIFSMYHMPSTGVSGLDLYASDSRGHNMMCHGRFSFGETISCIYSNLVYHDEEGYDFELFFPLYNGVKSMMIGVPEKAEFYFLEASKEKPILVYGTSIAQGACASRPAMAWTNVLKRELQLPFINWGFSGNGRMEPALFELMSQVDARLYIIDCMPNMNDMPDMIVPRLTEGVRKLRTKTDAPILIVEHDGYTNEEICEKSRKEYKTTNIECRKAYKQLKAKGVKNIWYLSHEDIGMNPEATVDDTHASDIGMIIYAKAYSKKIRKILHLKKNKKSSYFE